jgi:hypothetical protein
MFGQNNGNILKIVGFFGMFVTGYGVIEHLPDLGH